MKKEKYYCIKCKHCIEEVSSLGVSFYRCGLFLDEVTAEPISCELARALNCNKNDYNEK